MQRHPRDPLLAGHRTHASLERWLGKPHHRSSVVPRVSQLQLHNVVPDSAHGGRVQGWPKDVGGEALARLSVVRLDALPHKDLGTTGLGHGPPWFTPRRLANDTSPGCGMRTWVRAGLNAASLAANDAGEFSEFSRLERPRQRHKRCGAMRGGDEHAVGGDDVDMGARPKVGSDGVQYRHGACLAAGMPQLPRCSAFDRTHNARSDGPPERPGDTRLER